MSEKSTRRLYDWFLIGTFSFSVFLLAILIGNVRPQNPKPEMLQSTPEEVYFVSHTPLVSRPYQSYAGTGKAFPMEITSLLDAVSEDEALQFSCGEEFFNDGDGYYYREYGSHDAIRTVDDRLLLDAISQVEARKQAPRDLLGGQLCATETGMMIFQFTEGIGTYPYGASPEATTYLTLWDGNIWSQKIPLANHHLWPAPGCQVPLLVTREGVVYMACGEIDGTGGGSMTYSKIDVRNSQAVPLKVCTYSYKKGVQFTCE